MFLIKDTKDIKDASILSEQNKQFEIRIEEFRNKSINTRNSLPKVQKLSNELEQYNKLKTLYEELVNKSTESVKTKLNNIIKLKENKLKQQLIRLYASIRNFTKESKQLNDKELNEQYEKLEQKIKDIDLYYFKFFKIKHNDQFKKAVQLFYKTKEKRESDKMLKKYKKLLRLSKV